MIIDELDWLQNPLNGLRDYPQGTPFLLKSRTGLIHVCILIGDEAKLARRLSDGKYIQLAAYKNRWFARISPALPGGRKK